MNKIHRKVLLFIFTLNLLSLNGQSIFRVKGGINFSTIVPENDIVLTYGESVPKPGIHLGITIEKPQSKHLSIVTGLLFSSKGEKRTCYSSSFNQYYSYNANGSYSYYSANYTNSEYMYEIDPPTYESIFNTNLLYLEIPFTGKLSYKLGHTKIYGEFGPFLSIGCYGKSTYEILADGKTTYMESRIIDWGWDNNEIRPIDLAFTASAGFEINKMQCSVNYSWGIINVATYTNVANGIENRTLSFSTAYKF